MEARLKTASSIAVSLAAELPDSAWVHLVAEADRENHKLRIYLKGTLASERDLDLAGSLENGADFLVGDGFTDILAFVRVSRGTLADADTTIEELHAWQCDGPMLRDFTGKPRGFASGTAGALER